MSARTVSCALRLPFALNCVNLGRQCRSRVLSFHWRRNPAGGLCGLGGPDGGSAGHCAAMEHCRSAGWQAETAWPARALAGRSGRLWPRAGLLAVHFIVGGSARFASLSTAWMFAAGFVCLVGCVDDCFNLPSRLKLALQILSVLPIVLSKFYIGHVVAFGCPIELGWLGVPLTVLWLVGCINALNLLDGMDGLASIVGLSTAAMLGVIAASEGQFHIAIMALTLAAALAGFLVFNLPPASIFLGDSGSMVIGLTIGVLGIQDATEDLGHAGDYRPGGDDDPADVRRGCRRGASSADRAAVRRARPAPYPSSAVARGWTPWQVLYLIGAICLTMGGTAATAATIFRRDAFGWITAMTVVVLMIRLRLFGHDEFALAKETVIRGWK